MANTWPAPARCMLAACARAGRHLAALAACARADRMRRVPRADDEGPTATDGLRTIFIFAISCQGLLDT